MTCHAQKHLMDHALSPKCAQKFEEKERKKHISNLIQFFHFSIFSIFSLLGRVTLSRSSFIQTNIFCKRKQLFFYHFQRCIIIFYNIFYSRQNIIIFFTSFCLTFKNIFFEEASTTLIF